jgi:hypothetical protein
VPGPAALLSSVYGQQRRGLPSTPPAVLGIGAGQRSVEQVHQPVGDSDQALGPEGKQRRVAPLLAGLGERLIRARLDRGCQDRHPLRGQDAQVPIVHPPGPAGTPACPPRRGTPSARPGSAGGAARSPGPLPARPDLQQSIELASPLGESRGRPVERSPPGPRRGLRRPGTARSSSSRDAPARADIAALRTRWNDRIRRSWTTASAGNQSWPGLRV